MVEAQEKEAAKKHEHKEKEEEEERAGRRKTHDNNNNDIWHTFIVPHFPGVFLLLCHISFPPLFSYSSSSSHCFEVPLPLYQPTSSTRCILVDPSPPLIPSSLKRIILSLFLFPFTHSSFLWCSFSYLPYLITRFLSPLLYHAFLRCLHLPPHTRRFLSLSTSTQSTDVFLPFPTYTHCLFVPSTSIHSTAVFIIYPPHMFFSSSTVTYYSFPVVFSILHHCSFLPL